MFQRYKSELDVGWYALHPEEVAGREKYRRELLRDSGTFAFPKEASETSPKTTEVRGRDQSLATDSHTPSRGHRNIYSGFQRSQWS
jgi:hypothetical protein